MWQALKKRRTLRQAMKLDECCQDDNTFDLQHLPDKVNITVDEVLKELQLATNTLSGLLSPQLNNIISQLHISSNLLGNNVPTGKTVGIDISNGVVYYAANGIWVTASGNLPEVNIGQTTTLPAFGEKLHINRLTQQLFYEDNSQWQNLPISSVRRYIHNRCIIKANGNGVQVDRTTSNDIKVYVPQGVELESVVIHFTEQEGATAPMQISIHFQGPRNYCQDTSANLSDILPANIKGWNKGLNPIEDNIEPTTSPVAYTLWRQTVETSGVLKINTDVYATYYSGGGAFKSVIKIQL